MKTIDDREMQKQQKKDKQRQSERRGTKAIVKGRDLNDCAVH